MFVAPFLKTESPRCFCAVHILGKTSWPDTSQRQRRQLPPCPPWSLPLCLWNAIVENSPRIQNLGALALFKNEAHRQIFTFNLSTKNGRPRRVWRQVAYTGRIFCWPSNDGIFVSVAPPRLWTTDSEMQTLRNPKTVLLAWWPVPTRATSDHTNDQWPHEWKNKGTNDEGANERRKDKGTNKRTKQNTRTNERTNKPTIAGTNERSNEWQNNWSNERTKEERQEGRKDSAKLYGLVL